ncbi:MAG TPA: hypothetical protein VEJ63_18205 [Planctomycetota bacterium]|nr:hypothetical protein [Planctomycetota bacterium]
MKSFKFALPLMLALVVSAYIQAEDKPAAKEESWTGKLVEKAKDGKETAGLKVGDKTVALWAEGDVAKNLTEWAAKGAEVTVTGVMTDAGVKVSKAEPAKKKEETK